VRSTHFNCPSENLQEKHCKKRRFIAHPHLPASPTEAITSRSIELWCALANSIFKSNIRCYWNAGP